MVEGPPPTVPERPKGRLPRITRYMALAIYYEDLIRQGHVHVYAEIAALGHVTRARVTQIMNLKVAIAGSSRATTIFESHRRR